MRREEKTSNMQSGRSRGNLVQTSDRYENGNVSYPIIVTDSTNENADMTIEGLRKSSSSSQSLEDPLLPGTEFNLSPSFSSSLSTTESMTDLRLLVSSEEERRHEWPCIVIVLLALANAASSVPFIYNSIDEWTENVLPQSLSNTVKLSPDMIAKIITGLSTAGYLIAGIEFAENFKDIFKKNKKIPSEIVVEVLNELLSNEGSNSHIPQEDVRKLTQCIKQHYNEAKLPEFFELSEPVIQTLFVINFMYSTISLLWNVIQTMIMVCSAAEDNKIKNSKNSSLIVATGWVIGVIASLPFLGLNIQSVKKNIINKYIKKIMAVQLITRPKTRMNNDDKLIACIACYLNFIHAAQQFGYGRAIIKNGGIEGITNPYFIYSVSFIGFSMMYITKRIKSRAWFSEMYQSLRSRRMPIIFLNKKDAALKVFSGTLGLTMSFKAMLGMTIPINSISYPYIRIPLQVLAGYPSMIVPWIFYSKTLYSVLIKRISPQIDKINASQVNHRGLSQDGNEERLLDQAQLLESIIQCYKIILSKENVPINLVENFCHEVTQENYSASLKHMIDIVHHSSKSDAEVKEIFQVLSSDVIANSGASFFNIDTLESACFFILNDKENARASLSNNGSVKKHLKIKGKAIYLSMWIYAISNSALYHYVVYNYLSESNKPAAIIGMVLQTLLTIFNQIEKLWALNLEKTESISPEFAMPLIALLAGYKSVCVVLSFQLFLIQKLSLESNAIKSSLLVILGVINAGFGLIYYHSQFLKLGNQTFRKDIKTSPFSLFRNSNFQDLIKTYVVEWKQSQSHDDSAVLIVARYSGQVLLQFPLAMRVCLPICCLILAGENKLNGFSVVNICILTVVLISCNHIAFESLRFQLERIQFPIEDFEANLIHKKRENLSPRGREFLLDDVQNPSRLDDRTNNVARFLQLVMDYSSCLVLFHLLFEAPASVSAVASITLALPGFFNKNHRINLSKTAGLQDTIIPKHQDYSHIPRDNNSNADYEEFNGGNWVLCPPSPH